jgi:hypothetical protein
MPAGARGGSHVSPGAGRTAHARGPAGSYSDATSPGTRMEPHALLPRNIMTLLREDAGMSFMEFALIGSLVVAVCLLMLLALRRSA